MLNAVAFAVLDVVKAIIWLDNQLCFDASSLEERNRSFWDIDAAKRLC